MERQGLLGRELSSKMTGFTIPDVGLAPGGKIEQSRDAIAHYLLDMETIADAMAVDKYWDRPQYAILKEMYLDLKRMHYSFRTNRFCSIHFTHNSNLTDTFCLGARIPASLSRWRRWGT